MSKRGLPSGLKMRHDFHYVEELSKTPRIIGRMIPLDKIDPNPEQPRVEIGDLSELSASIKDKGVLEPLLVKPLTHQNTQRWMIIAGERRWRAARLAGLTEVPCVELDVDAAQIAEIALIENLQRKDLNVWEEADGLAALCQRFGYTHEDVARKIGKSRSTVTESLTIAGLPAQIREKCREAKINSKSIILQIARQFDEAAMLQAIADYRVSQNHNHETSAVVGKHEVNNLDNGRTKSEDSLTTQTKSRQAHSPQATDLSTPVRAFSYQSSEGDYKLALKFKKPVGKEDVILSLRKIIAELERS
ncbi:MAG: ParB/RepB/Spo0J family partition protein [Pyrinomonadaceae bacterium]